MIHISGYFAYLAMVWSCCSRINEGPLYNKKIIEPIKKLNRCLLLNWHGGHSFMYECMNTSKCSFSVNIKGALPLDGFSETI